MIKVESIKSYINSSNNFEFVELTNKIYTLTNHISKDYPEYKNWYFSKQISNINTEERNILFVRNPKDKNEIIGIAFLKKNIQEQKICTLYVSEKYRNKGIGTILIESSMKWLNTTKPLITFPDYKLKMFIPFIKKYGWQLTEIIPLSTTTNHIDLCYNKNLNKDKELVTHLIKILKKIKKT